MTGSQEVKPLVWEENLKSLLKSPDDHDLAIGMVRSLLNQERDAALKHAEEKWDSMRKDNTLWRLPQDILFDELIKRLREDRKE